VQAPFGCGNGTETNFEDLTMDEYCTCEAESWWSNWLRLTDMPLSDSSSLSACVEKISDFDMSRQLNEIVSRQCTNCFNQSSYMYGIRIDIIVLI